MKALILTIAVSLLAIHAIAQEKLVHIDSDQSLFTIDPKLNKRTKLFVDYDEFLEARLFQVSDSSFVLEISHSSNTGLARERIAMTAQEVAELRSRVTGQLVSKSPESLVDQSGRVGLMVSSSVVSLGYYGWALPTVLEIEDSRGMLASYMLVSSAGILAPIALTKGKEVTGGMSLLSHYGQTRGIVHGILLTGAVADFDRPRLMIGAGMAMSVAEGVVGYQYAKRTKMSTGQAAAIGAFSDFGFGIGLSTMSMTRWEKYDDREIPSFMLAGSALGLLSGHYLSTQANYTLGDAIMLRGSAALGAYIPLSIGLAVEDGNPRLLAGMTTAGMIGGLAAGHLIAANNEFSTGQGAIIDLTEVGCGLVGFGLGWLATEDAPVSAVMSSLSATLGFALMTKMQSKRNVDKASDKETAFHVSVNPLGLASLTGSNLHLSEQRNAPMISANLTF